LNIQPAANVHGRMKLRDYQQAAVSGAYKLFNAGKRRVIITMATGSGKSLIFKKMAHDAASRSSRVLLLVEGQDLVEQAANHMRVAGLRVAVEMADQRVDTRGDLLDSGPQVVVCWRAQPAAVASDSSSTPAGRRVTVISDGSGGRVVRPG
jgi:superfamily II DNA or RNA helicase